MAGPVPGLGAPGIAAAGALGFPAILRAQDVLKFGHLTPLTGFLGPLGEFAQVKVIGHTDYDLIAEPCGSSSRGSSRR